jgi:dTMP kinase
VTLIIIDGLDGSGKSTQALYISKFLQSLGKTVCLRVHPTNDNFFGVKTKQFLLSSGKNAHFASALFYMMDVIRSVLLFSWQRCDYIVFVRYLMGTAYLPSPLHKIAYHFFSVIVPKSQMMFFLDVTPEKAAVRISQNRNEKEMFENISALREVRRKALALAYGGKWIIVNADKPVSEVAETIEKGLAHCERYTRKGSIVTNGNKKAQAFSNVIL